MPLTWASRTAFGKRGLACALVLFLTVAVQDPGEGGAADAQSGLAQVPGGNGAWLSPAPALVADDPLALADPQSTAVIIFLPGSSTEGRPDSCRPLEPRVGTTPKILRELAGQSIAGKTLAVFGFCSDTKLGSFRKDRYVGTPKVIGRRDDLRALVRAFRAAGLPAEHLFLAGHSAGGWAALLLQRDDPAEINAVVAFAPAFTGPRDTRTASWSRLRREMVDHLGEAERLQALVMAVVDDPYNRPQDLAFLEAVPGVHLLSLESDSLAGQTCQGGDPHQLVYRDCFAKTQGVRINRYLEQRLVNAERAIRQAR